MQIAKLFPNNEHAVERVLRVAIGVVLLALVVVGPKSYWGLLGLLPLVTGLVGSCPAYSIFGINTCTLGRGTKPAGETAGGARH